MKNNSVIRRLDENGRLALPKAMFKQLQWKDREEIEVIMDGQSLHLRKHNSSCMCCGETKDIVRFKESTICSLCLAEIGAMASSRSR